MEDFLGHFLRNLVVSTVSAGILVVLGLGFWVVVQGGQEFDLWILSTSFLAGAVAFVAVSSYMHRADYLYRSCIFGGILAALVFTGFFFSLSMTFMYLSSAEAPVYLVPYVLLSFALAMIGSASVLWILRGKREQQETPRY